MSSLRTAWDIAVGSAVGFLPLARNMRVGQTLAYSFTGLMAVVAEAAKQRSSSLHVMSYNVRFDSIPDNITVQETLESLPRALPDPPTHYYSNVTEKPWSTRRILVANDILMRHVDVYGGQELLERQVYDLEELLGDIFAWIGVGREDGEAKGEFNPIFYNKHTMRLDDWDTFWLTSTPFLPSKHPEAGSFRIATTAHFVSPGGRFTMINTHLDDQSESARALGASLILHRAKYEAIKSKHPVILTGDFNSPTNDSAYRIITGQLKPEPLNETFTEHYNWTAKEGSRFEKFTMKDLLGETPPHRRTGNYATFTDFAAIGDTSQFQRLDYVFAGSNGGWVVDSYHVGENLRDDGVYASDHRPVNTNLRLGGFIELAQQ